MVKSVCVACVVATAMVAVTNDASAGWFGGRWFGGQCNSGYVTTGTYYAPAAPAQSYYGNPAQADPGAYPDVYNQAFNTGTYAPAQVPRNPAAGPAYRSYSFDPSASVAVPAPVAPEVVYPAAGYGYGYGDSYGRSPDPARNPAYEPASGAPAYGAPPVYQGNRSGGGFYDANRKISGPYSN